VFTLYVTLGFVWSESYLFEHSHRIVIIIFTKY